MKRRYLLSLVILMSGNFSFAQNVGINATSALPAASAMLDVAAANKGVLLPRVSLTGSTDVVTIPSPASSLLLYNTATAGTAPNNVSPGYYYWENARWNRLGTSAGSLIAFSSGMLNGATVVSYQPVIMGFGNNTAEIINGQGESTSPPQVGGFSFVAPFNGVIQNLQVSTDLLVASMNGINSIGLQYDFTVLLSPSFPNNGIDHEAAQYLTSPLTSSVRFGFPYTFVIPGTFRSSTNLNTGSIIVNAGDRIVVRVRTNQNTDPSASDITQLAFSASFMYTPVQ